MKIVHVETIIDTGTFSSSDEYQLIDKEVQRAITSIVNPPGSNNFTILNERKGNGVVPIKTSFIETLNQCNWTDERSAAPLVKDYRIDTTKLLSNNTFFGVEWETGNISSSHRAINRLLLGMQENVLSGGYLVLPSRNLYQYLTDRIGNFDELVRYFNLWRYYSSFFTNHVLKILVVEHDALSDSIPAIRKGTDGRALR